MYKRQHDALLTAGVSIPSVPSMRNYVAALHAQYGNSDTGFLPQSFHSHAKVKLQDILRILSRTGAKLGGKVSDNKPVLAERLAYWLNRVLDAARKKPGSASDDEVMNEEGNDACAQEQRIVLVEHTQNVGEMPQNAIVTAEQAESSLGRNFATELDLDIADAVDADTKEEEVLAGHQINPSGVDYSCISWQPNAPDSVSLSLIHI